MKRFFLLSIIGALAFSGIASAQNTIDSGTVDVTNYGAYSITNVTSGAGKLAGVRCGVITAPSGSPAALLNITVDGIGSGFLVNGTGYYYSTQWLTGALQLVGDGTHVGDTFFIPLNITYTTSLTITMNTINPGTAGSLGCKAYRNL